MKSFGIVVLGGGPAGSATAIELARLGHSVLLLERSRYETWRIGETLPPYAQLPLSALGVWESFVASHHQASHAIHSAWGSAELAETDFIFNAYGPGWHVDRKRFDEMLARQAEKVGATLWLAAKLKSAVYQADRWRVEVEVEGNPLTVEAEFLVDATGRARRLVRSQASQWLAFDQLIGLIGLLACETGAGPVPSLLLLEATERGWWYSAPLPNGSLLVAYMTDADYLCPRDLTPTQFWRQQLSETTHTTERCRGFRLQGDVRVKSAGSGRSHPVAAAGWIAVGDAASTFDPLSSAGVTKAMESGLFAAQCISAHLGSDRTALDDYALNISRGFDLYLEQRASYYGSEQRWTASRFWARRRLAASKGHVSMVARQTGRRRHVSGAGVSGDGPRFGSGRRFGVETQAKLKTICGS